MSQAGDLLNSLTEDQIAAYTVDPENEEHIVIDNDRYITVPDSLKRIAVQYDHDVETVTFDCPRYWDGADMSQMKVYINYLCPNNLRGMYLADNVTVDENDPSMMHFQWTISNNVTLAKGKISFLVCVKKTDTLGVEINHWNSELNDEMYISEGLECEEPIISEYPDIITALLTRMDYVETIATPENMQEYVNEYMNGDETLQQTISNHVDEFLQNSEPTSPEAMQEYVNNYLDQNPTIFAIGPNQPGVKCLWFNTGDGEETGDTTLVDMTPDATDGVYAEVEGTNTSYNFDIQE